MPHMVAPILAREAVADVLRKVTEAHRFLVRAGQQTITALAAAGADEWGQACKRTKVELPAIRPVLVQGAKDNHSFAEVVNQGATLERLIDALKWSCRELPGFAVEICHPTTSSQKTKEGRDNDLILVDADGHRCHFEVSDVASSRRDGNEKEVKDLVSLGVLESRTRPLRCSRSWPAGRLFLVVSAEFAERLMQPKRHRLKIGEIRYCVAGHEGTTRIIEVLKGTGEAAS